MNKLNKLTLPITILISSVILGTFYYVIQINKQRLVETQQNWKAKQEIAKDTFNNNLKCQDLLKESKQKLNDTAVDIYYDELQNTCMVKYIANGQIKEVPLENLEKDE